MNEPLKEDFYEHAEFHCCNSMIRCFPDSNKNIDFYAFASEFLKLSKARLVFVTYWDEENNLYPLRAFAIEEELSKKRVDYVVSGPGFVGHKLIGELNQTDAVKFHPISWNKIAQLINPVISDQLSSGNPVVFVASIRVLNKIVSEVIFVMTNDTNPGINPVIKLLAQQYALCLELKMVKDKLEQAQFESETALLTKSFFLANISHEIQTPINIVIGNADLLMLTNADETQKQYISKIIDSAKLLMDIINDLLDLSRIESGQLRIIPTYVDLYELCETTVAPFSINAKAKKLDFVFSFDPLIPRIAAIDPAKLQQVINNLLSNAIKFTHEGEVQFGVELIRLVPQKQLVRLKFAVKDTGIGIASHELKHIFDAFFQVDATSQRKYSGTGLGLAISRRIIEKMGGQIHVLSELNCGSVFSFEIETKYDPLLSKHSLPTPDFRPLKVVTETAVGSTVDNNSINEAVNLEPYRFLLIMPNLAGKAMVESVIRTFFPNSSLIDSFDYESALKHINKQRPDIILIDMHAHVNTGFRFINMVRSTENKEMMPVPVLCINSGVQVSTDKHCLMRETNECLIHPVKPVTLAKRINYWLSQVKSAPASMNLPLTDSGMPGNFDPQSLIERCGGDRELAATMLKLSISSFGEYIQNLRHYIHEKDFNMARSWAHTIKGAALNMSFNYIADKIDLINQMNDPDFITMDAIAAEIELAFREICKVVEKPAFDQYFFNTE